MPPFSFPDIRGDGSTFIEWSEFLSVYHNHLDDQHRELASIVNELYLGHLWQGKG